VSKKDPLLARILFFLTKNAKFRIFKPQNQEKEILKLENQRK